MTAAKLAMAGRMKVLGTESAFEVPARAEMLQPLKPGAARRSR
ncbi:MAG: hypothetical protein ACREFD_07905 [Stellaceae bacterium]